MADYKFTDSGGVTHLTTGMSIPNAPGNRHWQRYQEYVAAGGETLPAKDRDDELADLRARIVAKRQEMNNADFEYNGTLFVSDEPNIQGVRLRIEGLPDSDPIPTFTGTELASTWRSAENTFVPFNCGEFRAFSNFYYNHREKNFTNYTVLTIAAMTAYANGATAAEIRSFDISQGWD